MSGIDMELRLNCEVLKAGDTIVTLQTCNAAMLMQPFGILALTIFDPIHARTARLSGHSAQSLNVTDSFRLFCCSQEVCLNILLECFRK